MDKCVVGRIFAVLVISVACLSTSRSQSTLLNNKNNQSTVNAHQNFFVDKLVEIYGSNGTLDITQLKTLVDSIIQTQAQVIQGHGGNTHSGTSAGSVSSQKKTGVQDCHANNFTCLSETCLSAGGIFSVHDVPTDSAINSTGLKEISPTILYQLQNQQCHTEQPTHHKGKPKVAEVWGYGFLCVTLINLCALMGMVFLPLMRKSFYQRLLMYMVALAVGTLAGSSILFLIPEAFGLSDEGVPVSDMYIWKSTVIMGGVYMFFLVERVLKMIMQWRERLNGKSEKEEPVMTCSVKMHFEHHDKSMNMSFKPPPESSMSESQSATALVNQSLPVTEDTAIKPLVNGHTNGQLSNQLQENTKKTIKPVAWMIIFGDGLHNFIDGLSIGAAFADSILAGISISLAVICEELPHELGDFAILLNSGMRMKQALLYNFLSACMCYLGLIIGILVGEFTAGSHWIFALAGGMFLYISFVDMLPEVNAAAEEEEKETGRILPIFLLQNAGLLTGYGIMILLAYFGGQINLESS